jgi:hypothetical protein
MRKNNDAFSPVFSAILALLTVTSTMTSVVIWGVPYVNSLTDERTKEDISMQFNSVSGAISQLVNYNSGGAKNYNIDAGSDGTISVDKNESRLVLMYSKEPGYEFSVSGLEDIKSNQFHLWMNDRTKLIYQAHISWFDFGETCFLAGTKVLMADGSYKSIEAVEVGDTVKAYNERTGEMKDSKVAQVFHHAPYEMTDYYLLINDQLRVTPNHMFYSDGKWVCASDLKIGDPLFSSIENKNYYVYSISRVYEKVPTFDLEIEECHTYFVSITNGINVLVHNAPSITVLYPNDPGITWYHNKQYTIKWTPKEILGNVKIELLKGTTDPIITPIATVPALPGSYTWTVSKDVGTGSEYYIRITEDRKGGVSDQSDRPFSIDDMTITVTNPTNSITWYKNRQYTITWNVKNVDGNVNIDLLKVTDPNPIPPTVTVPALPGSYTWTVPNVATASDYKIRITSVNYPAVKGSSNNFKIDDPPSITVIYPNGDVGEDPLIEGQSSTITWSSTNVAPNTNVKIDLYKGIKFDRNIILSTPNDAGEASWTPPKDISGSEYRINISTIGAAPMISDMSDNYFTIAPPPSITVIYPNGGETLIKGQTYYITWDAVSLPDLFANIDLYKDGSEYHHIPPTDVYINAESCTWTVGGFDMPPGGGYKIRIAAETAQGEEIKSDMSDNEFTILDAPSITVVFPNGGDGQTLTKGVEYQIQWTSTNIVGDLRIDLYKGGTLDTVISSKTYYGGGVYSWTPAQASFGDDYKIRITSLDIGVFGESDNYFSIKQPITVIYPSSSVVTWIKGETYSIIWETYNVDGTVTIDLYRAGSEPRILSTKPASDGSYTWTVPNSLETASDYKIKITGLDSGGNEFSDESDNCFTIKDEENGHQIATYGVNAEIEHSEDDWIIRIPAPDPDNPYPDHFYGTVRIDLSYKDSDGWLGSIWIFDSDSLKYELNPAQKTYGVALENGGVLYSLSNGTMYVQNGPPAYERSEGSDKLFSFKVMQTKISSSSGLASSQGLCSLKLKFKGAVGGWGGIQENGKVYGLGMQFYGDNKAAWYSYFTKTYNFEYRAGYPRHSTDTLTYNDDVNLVLGHAFVIYSIE